MKLASYSSPACGYGRSQASRMAPDQSLQNRLSHKRFILNRPRLALLAATFLFLGTTANSSEQLDALLTQDTQRERCIAELRATGSNGLRTACEFRDAYIKGVNNKLTSIHSDVLPPDGRNVSTDLKMDLLNSAIDQIAGQRYGYLSKLYWYTDWDLAVDQAKREGKPILVLKMLGNLTDEFSCANSRFFRTLLYVDPKISTELRDRFVLYWSSVRPAPKITVDFGDGRKMERTITGNSAHYMVTHDGMVIDCLPGLYGPAAFHEWLTTTGNLAKQVVQAKPQDEGIGVRSYHLKAIGSPSQVNVATSIKSEIATTNAKAAVPASQLNSNTKSVDQVSARTRSEGDAPSNGDSSVTTAVQPPAAIAAAGRAISKLAVERPLLRQAWKDPNTSDQTMPLKSVTEMPPVNFSEQTLALIRSENPMQEPSNEQSLSKTAMTEQWSAMVENLRQSVAQDQSQNENQLHSQIHSWIITRTQYWRLPESLLLEKFNDRVYNELFLTPNTDPWLGLQTPEVYTGLRQGGIR